LRIIVPGLVYHVTHRGNRREAVFFDDEDRQYYCHWLDHCAQQHALKIYAYCLMKNHVHLVVEPQRAGSIAGTIHGTHRRHALWINRRHQWSGHLWGNRYFSTPLDAAHFRHAVRYVELNPVRAGIVQTAASYLWSSAGEHCGLTTRSVRLSPAPFQEVTDWANWLETGLETGDETTLRRCTYTGRPAGSQVFAKALELQLGRPLVPRLRGRPRLEIG
jgi:REP-associated tyrosine transposase